MSKDESSNAHRPNGAASPPNPALEFFKIDLRSLALYLEAYIKSARYFKEHRPEDEWPEAYRIDLDHLDLVFLHMMEQLGRLRDLIDSAKE